MLTTKRHWTTHPISWPGACTLCRLRDPPLERKRYTAGCLALEWAGLVGLLIHFSRARVHLLGRSSHDSPAQSCSFGARCRRRELRRLLASVTAQAAAAPRKAAGEESDGSADGQWKETHQSQCISAAHGEFKGDQHMYLQKQRNVWGEVVAALWSVFRDWTTSWVLSRLSSPLNSAAQPYAERDSAATATNFSPTSPRAPHIACPPPEAIMFSRAVPRIATRTPSFVPCEASQTAARLPSRSWRPVQHLSRRYRSTAREQFREQFRRSPIAFPFALIS